MHHIGADVSALLTKIYDFNLGVNLNLCKSKHKFHLDVVGNKNNSLV